MLKRFVLLTFLIAFGLAFVSAITASACETDNDDFPNCTIFRPIKPTETPAPKAPPRPAAAQPTAVAAMRGGSSPDDALDPNDAWLNIGAGGALWFRIGEGINAQHLDVWLDANGNPGIAFAVYSPEQMNDPASRVHPKGRGTFNRTIPHDLFWSGQAPRGGVWYVLVTSSNSVPVPFKVGYNRVESAQRDCTGPYWEYIGPNLVLWPGHCK